MNINVMPTERLAILCALTAYESAIGRVIKAKDKLGLDTSLERDRLGHIDDARRALSDQKELGL